MDLKHALCMILMTRVNGCSAVVRGVVKDTFFPFVTWEVVKISKLIITVS